MENLMNTLGKSSNQTMRAAKAFASRVCANQRTLRAGLKSSYDFIVCGSGSAGSVVARRLAENPDVSVLVLEAGGDDDAPNIMEAASWPGNLGSERDWGFKTRPSPHLNGRSLLWSMGKVLGGGSSINAMIWSRGHKNDWDYFAAETGDPAWSYEAVLQIYRRIEDWHGEPDSTRRGTGGLLFVQRVPDPNPIAPAMLEAARSIGIPTFADQNGVLMEGKGGCALANVRIRDGRRLSIFRSYLYAYMDRPNLTVLTGALVTKVIFDGKRATGVEVLVNGAPQRFAAGSEVVLSLGAIHTPKVLMQSGIGDREELGRFDIDVVQHLPGMGRNLQDHLMVAGCVWEYEQPLPVRNNGGEATLFWKSDPALDTPDLQPIQVEMPYVSPETARLNPPAASWSLAPGLVRPRSRGRLRLTGASPSNPVDIDAELLSDPADLRALTACVRLCRAIGNSVALRPFTKREIMPGDLPGPELEYFVRDAVVPYWHQSCTAKMGRDSLSVVDGELRVYGVDNLRIADASVMPRVTTGNTMAPCVIIGERGAELVRRSHRI
jgi:choline dehydrogenase